MDQASYVRALAAITHAQIDAAGMTAENMRRERRGASMAYDDSAFFEVAREMERIVSEQLQVPYVPA